MSSSKFKVGDVVRITGDSSGYSESFVGQERKVLEADKGLYSLRVSYNSGLTSTLTFWENDLEIVKTHYDSVPLQQAMQGWNEIVINNGVVTELKHCDEHTGKIKSDGNSSDYYKLEINGNPVEVEDIIYAMVGGDFALGNAIKAIRRMYLDSLGQGKEGIDMEYDKNKVVYFANSFVNRFGANNAN
jgi:hypothetical protein